MKYMKIHLSNYIKNSNRATVRIAIIEVDTALSRVRPFTIAIPKITTIDKQPKTIKGVGGQMHDVTTIPDVNNITQKQQLDKIKESLHQGKAISVEVTTNSGSKHWVVVTGTIKNCTIDNISSIDDLVGIDPWYGSCSLNQNDNLTINTDVNATINLGDKNSKLGCDSGYGYMTVD